MGEKSRGNFKIGLCITEEPCGNRGKKCDKCFRKNLYYPKSWDSKEKKSG